MLTWRLTHTHTSPAHQSLVTILYFLLGDSQEAAEPAISVPFAGSDSGSAVIKATIAQTTLFLVLKPSSTWTFKVCVLNV